MKKTHLALITMLIAAACVPTAHAQFAVVDVGAIKQLIQQVTTMRQQLETTRGQLTQAQMTYASMTGGRGMEQLLAGTVRNYLPADWGALEAAIRQSSGGGYGALGREVKALTTANAVLSAQFVSALSAEDRVLLEAARRSVALQQAISRLAVENSSQRFASLQQLIDAVGRTQDSKGALDLQARTAGEVAMLNNDHMKLIAIFQAAEAEDAVLRQRTREQAIASIGSLRDLPPIGLAP